MGLLVGKECVFSRRVQRKCEGLPVWDPGPLLWLIHPGVVITGPAAAAGVLLGFAELTASADTDPGRGP